MKAYTQYICQQCDYHSSSFLGRCPQCGEWNSLVESVDDSTSNGQINTNKYQSQIDKELIKLSEVRSQDYRRLSTGYSEFDRVLGGGIVPGSIALIAGDPGIGKSTLLLETAIAVGQGATIKSPNVILSEAKDLKIRSHARFASEARRAVLDHKSADLKDSSSLRTQNDKKEKLSTLNSQFSIPTVLYVTGEESAQQVKIRGDRLERLLGNWVIGSLGEKRKAPNSLKPQSPSNPLENVYILAVASVEAIVAAVEKINPTLVIVDSIQTMTTEKLEGPAGSVGQVRETSSILQRLAKKTHVPIFLVGHVTKEGNVAGPKVLEHLVDAVLNLEGDGMHTFRLLRSIKNRFGSTMEVGVFEMTDGGMKEISNPSQIFLSEKLSGRPGSVVCSTIAGGRPLLAEVQALVNPTVFGMPARKITGLDFGRMQIVIASLGRSAKISTGTLDIYVNVAGGLKIEEPAADLAAAIAIASAVSNKPVPEKLCAFGEVGLLGELRMVGNIKSRISEAKRLGFSDFVSPEKFKTLEEAVRYAIK